MVLDVPTESLRFLCFLVLGSASLIISGCGVSDEDRVYKAFKCGKVASLLEYEREAQNAMMSAEASIMKLSEGGGNSARFALEMNDRFQDDVPLYRLSVGGQMQLLSKIFRSDECQGMYKYSRD